MAPKFGRPLAAVSVIMLCLALQGCKKTETPEPRDQEEEHAEHQEVAGRGQRNAGKFEGQQEYAEIPDGPSAVVYEFSGAEVFIGGVAVTLLAFFLGMLLQHQKKAMTSGTFYSRLVDNKGNPVSV
eukprot:TRINITY_DN3503_c0_g2_i2.p1 TRINITY_DN3503_c0_g2~~TRINITY_DN3503_c0_g2_i2.p1  ORF type:complete len:148 (+),score=35.11 TRINITY_DN3503_c0_g2_i2:68-445(+)